MVNTKSHLGWCAVAMLTVAMACSDGSADVVLPVQPAEYSSGHADIGLAYDGQNLTVNWNFGQFAILDGAQAGGGSDGRRVAPSDAYARVPDSTKRDSKPNGFDFTGWNLNDPPAIWELPFSNQLGVPFLGLATELNPNDWEGPSTWTLVEASMPDDGQFSLWNPAELPDFRFSTLAGFNVENSFDLGFGGHEHVVWGFSQAGVYDITLQVDATHREHGAKTAVGTFKFVVGDATAVPEAGTVTLLALGSLGLIVGGWHQRRRRSVAKGEAAAA